MSAALRGKGTDGVDHGREGGVLLGRDDTARLEWAVWGPRQGFQPGRLVIMTQQERGPVTRDIHLYSDEGSGWWWQR